MYTLFIPTTGQFLQVWGGLAEAERDRAYWADHYGISPDRITIARNGRQIEGK